MARKHVTLCLVILFISNSRIAQAIKPNVIIILADDLGWNDVGFHGSNQIPTPNIDALAYTGITLKNYYTMPVCTPSRAALMTGRHPIHTGMQNGVISEPEPWGLGLDEKLLPEYLKELSYDTHAVGKWHLGFFKKEYTPTYRGFDSFYGFWGGHQDYFNHSLYQTGFTGYDLRDNMEVAYEPLNEYATRLYTKKAEDVILNHNTSNPLFLYVAHLATHTSNSQNPNNRLQAPNETIELFNHIQDYNRRVFAAMVYELDLSVGRIVKTLADRNILNESIIIFSTDNGGCANGRENSAGTNWPLRGVKETLWEGGVRGVSLIWSPLLNSSGYVSNQLSHIQDWLPTIINAINATDPQNLDGVNLWPAFNNPNMSNVRDDLLITISDAVPYYALRYNKWKLMTGSIRNGSYDGIYLPDGREDQYNYTALYNSDVYYALQFINISLPTNEIIDKFRHDSTVNCALMNNNSTCDAFKGEICLFNIEEDPCEEINLATQYPDILQFMLEKLNEYNATVVPSRKVSSDPTANPSYWNNTWINWKDYPSPILFNLK